MDHQNNYRQETQRGVMLVAFHFPPQSESSGIQRTLSFARNLGGFGWSPMVVSAAPMAYETKNASQLASVPESVPVARPLALDAKRHLGWQGKYPGWLALPDRWSSWWLFAVPAALRMIRQRRPQALWSTFPIATAHLIGLTLQRLTGLPWVADFRDPMLQPDYPQRGLQRRLYGWIERHALARCTLATFTTHAAMRACKARFPASLHHKFHVIENGYDEQSFAAAPELPPPSRDPGRRLTLVHSGVLYTEGRDPTMFLRALAALRQQGRVDAARLQVILRAPGDLPYFRQLVEQCQVADLVRVEPPVPYREALAEMLGADGLLVFQGTPFNNQIPAKIYEYFRARKPVLGLLDPAGETAIVLRAAGFDDIAPMDAEAAIAPVLLRFLDAVRDGQAHIASEALIQASSRTGRAQQLAQLLTACLDGSLAQSPSPSQPSREA